MSEERREGGMNDAIDIFWVERMFWLCLDNKLSQKESI